MANLRQTASRLQAAIIRSGGMVKLNTRQFYSQEQGRMITRHSVTVPVWSDAARKMVDREQLATCSMAEVVKYLAGMLEELRGDT